MDDQQAAAPESAKISSLDLILITTDATPPAMRRSARPGGARVMRRSSWRSKPRAFRGITGMNPGGTLEALGR